MEGGSTGTRTSRFACATAGATSRTRWIAAATAFISACAASMVTPARSLATTAGKAVAKAAAAVRETQEEVNLRVTLLGILDAYSFPGSDIVVIVYAADVVGEFHVADQPGEQVVGEQRAEQVGPVGVEFLSREFLQAKAALMLLARSFHLRRVEVPDDNLTRSLPLLVGQRGVLFPVQLPVFRLGQLPVDLLHVTGILEAPHPSRSGGAGGRSLPST